MDGLIESIGLHADAPYGGLCVAYFNGDYPTALDDYEQDFLDSLSPDDLVRLPGYDHQKTMYEGTEYTHKVNGRHASVDPTDYCIANE